MTIHPERTPALPRLAGAAKQRLRDSIGLWPLLEARNRLTLGPRSLALRRFESAEVARLRAQVGDPAPTLVTTVMPTYRRPDQLRVALASALAQTVTDHQVVVVADGAGLPEDLTDDPRVVAVSLSRNSAVLGLVRNVGIRLTRSEFVAFLDDDNQWNPDHLERALAVLTTRRADVVYTAVERRLASGELLDTLSTPFDRRTLRDASSYVDSNALVVRRDPRVLFSRLPRTKATMPKEDWEFVHRLSRSRTVEHLPDPTVRYLVNTESYYTAWTPDRPD